MPDAMQNLRTKYPQYSDLSDSVLASKIIAKYPQYQDVLGQYAQSGAPPQATAEIPYQNRVANVVHGFANEASNIFTQFGKEPISETAGRVVNTALQVPGLVYSPLTEIPGPVGTPARAFSTVASLPFQAGKEIMQGARYVGRKADEALGLPTIPIGPQLNEAINNVGGLAGAGPISRGGIKGIELATNPLVRNSGAIVAAKEIKRVAPPQRKELNYDQAQQTALSYLKQEQLSAPIKTVREATVATDKAINSVQDKLKPAIQAFGEVVQIDKTKIISAAEGALKGSARTPQELSSGMKLIRDLIPEDKPLTLLKADEIRQRLNSEINAKMADTKANRSDARKTNSDFAANEAAADALRDEIYNSLENVGVQGVRELRRDQGSLIQMRNAFERNIVKSEKEGAVAPGKRVRQGLVGTIAGGAAGSIMGPVGGAMGAVTGHLVANTIADATRTYHGPNQVLERAMKRLESANLPPVRDITITHPNIRGLLGPATSELPVGGESSMTVTTGKYPDVEQMINPFTRGKIRPQR